MNLFDHNDNFEQFLREATENFRMSPSIRVWNSIYNNIHPSKKSPSAAALLVFLISFFILNINNSTVSQQSISIENKNAVVINKNQVKAYSDKIERHDVHKKQSLLRASAALIAKKIIERETNSIISSPLTIENDNAIVFSNLITSPLIQDNHLQEQFNHLTTGTEIKENFTRQKTLYIPAKNNNESELSYQLYATSSVGYSNSFRNEGTEVSNSSTNHLQSVNDINRTLRYMPEYNLEAGGAFLVNVTSSLKLKAGMQLNYTNYKLTNNESNSEIANSESYNSIINNTAQTNEIQLLNLDMNSEFKKFNSSTYQISIPLGTELELVGNHQLKWFAGATIQPSYVVGGYPGQNTNETKNYLDDGYEFRKWNVNTSFETFLSYKLPNGSRINAGPQFRYQLFSSYESKYLYNEKQYNIGLKLGISRNF